MKRRLVPERSQWRKWSLPSKASYFSAIIGVLGLFVGISGLVISMMPSPVTVIRNSTPMAIDDRIKEINLSLSPDDVYTGNVTYNDNFGEDGPGVPPLLFADRESQLRGHQFFSFEHGSIKIEDDGSYELKLDRSVTYNHNYEVNYTIQDADGDVASAILHFSVTAKSE